MEAAIAKARSLWGDSGWAHVSSYHDIGCGASNACQVGVRTKNFFHVYGEGPTWNAAFEKAEQREFDIREAP